MLNELKSEADSSIARLFFSVAGRPQHLVRCRTTDEVTIVTVRCSQPSACKPGAQPAAGSRCASPFVYTLLFRVHRMRRIVIPLILLHPKNTP
jgi:hypothetical protein